MDSPEQSSAAAVAVIDALRRSVRFTRPPTITGVTTFVMVGGFRFKIGPSLDSENTTSLFNLNSGSEVVVRLPPRPPEIPRRPKLSEEERRDKKAERKRAKKARRRNR